MTDKSGRLALDEVTGESSDAHRVESNLRPSGAQIGIGWLDAAPLIPTFDQARFDRTKRVLECIASVIALVLLLPVFAILAVVSAFGTKAWPIYVQQRIGRDGRPFPCLKFRTMYRNAPERLDALLAADDEARAEWEAGQKLRRDPRIAPFGRTLRSTNLDELPQLVNIVLGQMSLVGPRPIVFAEVPKYGPALRTVLTVRPGLTGLWQVSGRNTLSYEERVRLDQEYVITRSTRCDATILTRTAKQTLRSLLGGQNPGAW